MINNIRWGELLPGSSEVLLKMDEYDLHHLTKIVQYLDDRNMNLMAVNKSGIVFKLRAPATPVSYDYASLGRDLAIIKDKVYELQTQISEVREHSENVQRFASSIYTQVNNIKCDMDTLKIPEPVEATGLHLMYDFLTEEQKKEIKVYIK